MHKVKPTIHLTIATLTLLHAGFSDAMESAFHPTSINTAEAVLEVFWDEDITDFSQWTVDPNTQNGLRVYQGWDAVYFEWTSNNEGPALRMTRKRIADCSGYDTLILGMTAPKNARVSIAAETDKGTLQYKSPLTTGKKDEYVLDLQGASQIDSLTIEIDAQDKDAATGWMNWIVLQNTERLKRHLDRWNHFDSQWTKHIRAENYKPSFQPYYGVFVNEDDLKEYRELHDERIENNQASPFVLNTDAYQPEAAVKQYHSGNVRLRHSREPSFSSLGVKAALAGLVRQDASLLRLAARHALSLCVCQHWDYGFTTQFSLSSWESRNFKRSYICEDVAYILDLAGEMFTTAGRRLVLRKLAEEGVGPINYGTWRHEYIFDCNQLAFFNTGRMAAYLVLEREYPRVKPYTDIAYRESIENVERSISPDGGYYEGPGYFGSIARRNSKVIRQYAKARGLEGLAAVPGILKKTNDYAAAVASTTIHRNLPICDCDADSLDADTLITLANLLPDSYWTTLCRKVLRDSPPHNPDDLLAARRIPAPGPDLPAFVCLPDTGYIASHRKLGGEWVKLFIMGNIENAGHCHEDKGSFILEFAGETFAADLGVGSYKDPLHRIYKQCQRHNMLVPQIDGAPVHPQNPLPFEVKPTGNGDETRFTAQIDATPGWNGAYKKWRRRWTSPTPDRITIEDEYELNKGNAVEFYWQTQLPCEIKGDAVVITGQKGQAKIQIPDNCIARIDVLPLQNDGKQNRIVFRKEKRSGTLTTKINLSPLPLN